MKPKAIAQATKTPDLKAQIAALVPLARADEKAAAELWKLLEANGIAEGFARVSDIAFQAEKSMLGAYGRTDVLGKQMDARRLALLRRELAGPNPTPLEVLLVERIALCWHHLHMCETVVAQNAGTMNLGQAAYQDKRLNSAHKRYLGAIKALAQVRKLQLPNVQVNIGEKQVNIGQVTAAP